MLGVQEYLSKHELIPAYKSFFTYLDGSTEAGSPVWKDHEGNVLDLEPYWKPFESCMSQSLARGVRAANGKLMDLVKTTQYFDWYCICI